MFPTKHALTWRWLFASLTLFAAASSLQWQLGGRFVVPAHFWRYSVWEPADASEQALAAIETGTERGRDGDGPQRSLPLTTYDAVREVMGQGALPSEWVEPLVSAIQEESRTNNLDPFLVLAIISVESQFNPDAVSNRGARGLMQLMPETEEWLRQRLLSSEGLTHAAAMDLNVRLGMRYFARLQRSFGRVDRALQAYNCGPKRLADVLHDTAPLPYQSEVYAQRVLRRYHRLKRDYAYLL